MSTSSTVMKGVGAIVVSVTSAVLIYYLTRPAPTPPPPEATEINGYVADAASHTLIPRASVVFALGSQSVSQLTDDQGRYNVVLEGTGAGPVMGNVSITANGYMPYRNTVALQPGDNFAEITLQSNAQLPVATNPPGHATPAVPLHAPVHAAIMLRAPPPNYIKSEKQVILRAKP
jgi:hypothetical protein